MQSPPPKLPEKERRFLPGMNDGGFRARFSVKSTLEKGAVMFFYQTNPLPEEDPDPQGI
jgi:hypothetical protein